jgi:hypothetical protein
VRTADGRASFDNTYDARAARLQAKWRSALAAIYAEVTAHLTPAGATRADSSGNG